MHTQKGAIPGWVIGAIVVGVAILLLLSGRFFNARDAKEPVTVFTTPENLSGIQKGDAPWAPEIGNLVKRLRDIGLQPSEMEGAALHMHEHLTVFVNGASVEVPANIGIHSAARLMSPVHTHDTKGIIHVESHTVQSFYLGQIFDVWGVYFTKDCIGGYCSDSEGNKKLSVYVNGALYAGDPRTLELKPHQELTIVYGTQAQLPNPIPSSYTFPPGY